MSTELQKYSIESQRDAIGKFAAANGMKVTHTFEDHGKSGLTLRGRPGLQDLLQSVADPQRQFDAVLVYDVSRWGRFQDADESAFYEYFCRRAGVDVIYCAEAFNAYGPMGVVIKSVKRAMAAEYSKDLSAKVSAAMELLARRGYHAGGPAGFALKRVQVSDDRLARRDLPSGERKSRIVDHVELMPGNPFDCGLVRLIFHLFVRCGLKEYEIAAQLNWNCYPSRVGLNVWRAHSVRAVLRNEQYIGTSVYGASTQRLHSPARYVPEAEQIRTPGSFDPIVSPEIFAAAQQLVGERKKRRHWSNEELLEFVRQAFREGKFVYAMPRGRPSTYLYIMRFGSLAGAYRAAGFPAPNRTVLCGIRRERRQEIKEHLFGKLADHVRESGRRCYVHPTSRRACIDGRLTISIRIVHPQRPHGSWYLRPDRLIKPDKCLFVRVTNEGEILDYFVVPGAKNRDGFVSGRGKPFDWLKKYHCPTWDVVLRRLDAPRISRGPVYIPRSFKYMEDRRSREENALKNKAHEPRFL